MDPVVAIGGTFPHRNPGIDLGWRTPGQAGHQTANGMSPAHAPTNNRWRTWVRRGVIQALRLTVVGVLLGWLYGWAAPVAYPKTGSLGFGYGMAHGALMPMALPSLLMGKDVEIFAPNHNGRPYKIGYIVGINVCGLVFFGLGFARPPERRRASESDA